MKNYFWTFIILFAFSCNSDQRENKNRQVESVTSGMKQQSTISQSDSKLTSANINIKKLGISQIEKNKQVEIKDAEIQFKKDVKNSKLTNISCEEIFDTYKKLILRAKKSRSKMDIQELNKYKYDPNFKECRMNSKFKEIYNNLEKLKHSRQN